MKQQRGFGLVGTLIGIAIAAVAMFGMMQLMGRSSRQQIQSDGVTQSATELKMLRDAVGAFNVANSAAWANGLRREITIAELVAGGFLPSAFATRYNIATAGTTPLGQQYAVVAIKADSSVPPVLPGTVRTVIFQRQAPLAGALERLMITNEAAQIMGFQRRVAVAGNQSHKLVTGWIQSGANTAQGVGGAFVKQIGPWLAAGGGTAPAHAAVVFIGFPDLGGDDGGGGPGGTLAVGDCVVAQARPALGNPTYLVEQTCPANYPINAGSWPHCRYEGGPVSVALPLVGTAVTLVESYEQRQEMSHSQCHAYATARYNYCLQGNPVNAAICQPAYNPDVQDCLYRQSEYRRTAITLNSGNIAGPETCAVSKPYIDAYNSIQYSTFVFDNPQARDQYCCQPPP